MKRFTIAVASAVLSFAANLFAQGYGGPLTFEGIERADLRSVASRGAGGVAILTGDVASMFDNPAVLGLCEGPRVAVAGLWFSEKEEQKQEFAPVRYYPNLSLLLEGLTANIPDPNPDLPGFSPSDTVQRPYDDIKPNWSWSNDARKLKNIVLAVPVQAGGVRLIAGAGAVLYADLDHYYQNNNVLSPAILSQRPLPIMRPTDDNPLPVDWYQTVRSRKGAINGYGAALAGEIEKWNLSFGFSALALRGESDDYEAMRGRGKLTFYSNAFRNDSVAWSWRADGTSEFRGYEVTLGGLWAGKYARIGFGARLPAEIKRSYTKRIHGPETGLRVPDWLVDYSKPGSAEERLKLPWRGSMSIVLLPREWFALGFEYEIRPYKSARYIDANENESSPWLSASLFRIGASLRLSSALTLRLGMRDMATVFEPEGNHLPGEPVRYSVYSLGLGGVIGGSLAVDLAVERWGMKYEDIWSSEVSKNQWERWVVLGQISYAVGSSR